MDLEDAAAKPLYLARVSYNFIGSEPGFYGSSTFFGAQDVLALGAAVRYQQDHTIMVDAPDPDDPAIPFSDDLTEFNADLLAEFSSGAGTFTGELAYYNFSGDTVPAQNHFFVVLSYATPEPVGIGKIQPTLRFQMANNSDTDLKQSQIEAMVNYVIKDYFAKLSLGFVHSQGEIGGGPTSKANMLQLGFQIQQ
jgi:hypothetical protein